MMGGGHAVLHRQEALRPFQWEQIEVTNVRVCRVVEPGLLQVVLHLDHVAAVAEGSETVWELLSAANASVTDRLLQERGNHELLRLSVR